MTPRVMSLDVLKLRRFPKRRFVPIQMSHPFVDGGVSGPDVPDVALEVLDVDGVEADYGRVESDVGFGYVGPVVVGRGVCRQMAFGAVA